MTRMASLVFCLHGQNQRSISAMTMMQTETAINWHYDHSHWQTMNETNTVSMNFSSFYNCYKKQWKNKNITCFFRLGLNYNIILHDPFPDYLSQDNLVERKENYCFKNFALCIFIMCGYI